MSLKILVLTRLFSKNIKYRGKISLNFSLLTFGFEIRLKRFILYQIPMIKSGLRSMVRKRRQGDRKRGFVSTD